MKFRKYLPVGRPTIAVEFLNSWGIDEIILLDITASKDRATKRYDYISEVAESCFVPLAVGGGIDSIDDIKLLLKFGADKACVNSHCLRSPEFIADASAVFGSQCIVVGIDVVGSSVEEYRVYDAATGRVTDLRPLEWALEVQARGAGEIYLTSVDRDGTKSGFDLNLIAAVTEAVRIPVIASGGAGNAAHILEAFATGVSAVSAANFFHFYEHSVIVTKAALRREHVNIRLNTHANYSVNPLDGDFRLEKLPDAYLQDLLFEKIVKEVI